MEKPRGIVVNGAPREVPRVLNGVPQEYIEGSPLSGQVSMEKVYIFFFFSFPLATLKNGINTGKS